MLALCNWGLWGPGTVTRTQAGREPELVPHVLIPNSLLPSCLGGVQIDEVFWDLVPSGEARSHTEFFMTALSSLIACCCVRNRHHDTRDNISRKQEEIERGGTFSRVQECL